MNPASTAATIGSNVSATDCDGVDDDGRGVIRQEAIQ